MCKIRTRKLLTIILLVVLFVEAALFLPINTSASSDETVSNSVTPAPIVNLTGKDRIETAVNIANYFSQNFYSEASNGDHVAILVGYDSYVDGLAAAGLSGARNAPILYTNGAKLCKEIKETLQNMDITLVYLIGESSVIPSTVENQLDEMAICHKRLAGKDRCETSLAIAMEMEEIGVLGGIISCNSTDADIVELATIAAKYKSQYQNYQKRENNFYQFRHTKLATRIINIFNF